MGVGSKTVVEPNAEQRSNRGQLRGEHRGRRRRDRARSRRRGRRDAAGRRRSRRGRRRPAAGRRRVPVLRVRAEQDDDPSRRSARRGPSDPGDVRAASTVEPDWTPVADRIRDEATDDWDDQIAVDRLVDAGVALRARHGSPGGRAHRGQVGDETFVCRVAGWSSTPGPSRRCRRSTDWRTRRTGRTATPSQLTEAAGFADRDRRRCDRRWSWRRCSPGSAST